MRQTDPLLVVLALALTGSACATHHRAKPGAYEQDADDWDAGTDSGADAGIPTFWGCSCTLTEVPDAAAIADVRSPCTVDDPVADIAARICLGAADCECTCHPIDHPITLESGEPDPRCLPQNAAH